MPMIASTIAVRSCSTPRASTKERSIVGAQPGPGQRVAAGVLLHPAPDRLDQAAVLGDLDEIAGVEQAALGMAPAHQRLEADDLAAADRDHRLVVELQLFALQRV